MITNPEGWNGSNAKIHYDQLRERFSKLSLDFAPEPKLRRLPQVTAEVMRLGHFAALHPKPFHQRGSLLQDFSRSSCLLYLFTLLVTIVSSVVFGGSLVSKLGASSSSFIAAFIASIGAITLLVFRSVYLIKHLKSVNKLCLGLQKQGLQINNDQVLDFTFWQEGFIAKHPEASAEKINGFRKKHRLLYEFLGSAHQKMHELCHKQRTIDIGHLASLITIGAVALVAGVVSVLCFSSGLLSINLVMLIVVGCIATGIIVWLVHSLINIFSKNRCSISTKEPVEVFKFLWQSKCYFNHLLDSALHGNISAALPSYQEIVQDRGSMSTSVQEECHQDTPSTPPPPYE